MHLKLFEHKRRRDSSKNENLNIVQYVLNYELFFFTEL